MIAHIIYFAVVLVVGGFLGYRYGSKVEADAQAEVTTVESDIKKV